MQYFDAGPTASYNGVFTFFLSNRNYGKTWGFQRRQAQRALKHGKSAYGFVGSKGSKRGGRKAL